MSAMYHKPTQFNLKFLQIHSNQTLNNSKKKCDDFGDISIF